MPTFFLEMDPMDREMGGGSENRVRKIISKMVLLDP